MQVTVRLFGAIREAAGAKELAVDVTQGTTVGALRALLAREHPAFEAMGTRLRASVNFEVVPHEHVLRDGDEVAFLPPVAGGQEEAPAAGPAAPRCTLSATPLDPAEVTARVAGPDAGGLVTFVGTVRDHSRGRSIRHLEYEAYPGMAEREMERIADEAAERFGGARVAMAHRTGHLAVGEIAVVVVAAAAHRDGAFGACRFAIDTLKERVPIWKKEVATDGEYWVEEHA